MIMGVILTLLGVFSIANAGLTFISMAFPIGVILTAIGITECISYRSRYDDEEDRHWVLIDGLTTFILGIVVLTGQLAADIAVPVVFGMWSMVAGIRYLVIITHVDIKEEKNLDFYWTVVVSVCNFVVGLYTFFNSSLFNLSVLMMLGILFVIQGISVIKVGFDTTYRKPDLIKTKEELVAEAERKAEEARAEAKIAVKKARRAKAAIKEAEEIKVTYDIFNEPVVPPEELLRKSADGEEEAGPEDEAGDEKQEN